MKPAPFENVEKIFNEGNFKLTSVQTSKGMTNRGRTELFDASGREIWRLPFFIGRKQADLSKDGLTLVLSGNLFFGSIINVGQKNALVEVWRQGKKILSVGYQALYGKSGAELAKKFDIGVRGGGWIPYADVIKDMTIDWEKNQLTFLLRDQKLKIMSWETTRRGSWHPPLR